MYSECTWQYHPQIEEIGSHDLICSYHNQTQDILFSLPLHAVTEPKINTTIKHSPTCTVCTFITLPWCATIYIQYKTDGHSPVSLQEIQFLTVHKDTKGNCACFVEMHCGFHTRYTPQHLSLSMNCVWIFVKDASLSHQDLVTDFLHEWLLVEIWVTISAVM